jgi:hypothetical protein
MSNKTVTGRRKMVQKHQARRRALEPVHGL